VAVVQDRHPLSRGAFGFDFEPDELLSRAALIARLDQHPAWAQPTPLEPGRPPVDLVEYDRWVRTVVERYRGRVTAYTIWNEPNLAGFWPADMPAYFEFYANTVAAVKSIDPDLRVGGPATAGRVNAHIDEFLRFCKDTNTPVEFVTAHSYSATANTRKGEFAYGEVDDVTFLTNRFSQMRAEIDASPIPGLPLHVTEYNSTTSTHGIIHDLPFNAAYLARTLSEASPIVDSMAYWALSDIFVEESVPPAEFHGGFGLINIHDIPKPTYTMFAFFAQLGTTVLHRSANALFTRREDGHIVGVLWNPNDASRATQQVTHQIELATGSTTYTARTLLVDETHGNAYRAWEMMGRHRNPSREQVELLREASRPACAHLPLAITDGMARLELTLETNACMLVDLMPVDDQTASYYELDQAFYANLSLPG